MDITVWSNSESPNNEAGEYLNEVLTELGFNTTLKLPNGDNYTTIIGSQSTPDLDAGWGNWFQDYPHPNDFFQPLLAGESIQPTNNYNFANFDEPAINKQITKLGEEQLGPEQEEAYAKLDEEIMELAPWAPFGNRNVSTFVSDEIDLDSVVFNPTMGQYLSSFEFK
jgi:peptide/nickel transport system substrate-binding protein